jgi:hypothetical protein
MNATNEGKAKVKAAIVAIVTKAKELGLPTKGAGDFAAMMLAAGALINGDAGQITSADVLAVLAEVSK